MLGRFLLTAILLGSQQHLHSAETACLIPVGGGAQWRYQDDVSSVSPNWAKVEFDDQKWKSGPAPLGYGDDAIATKISYGDDPDNKPASAVFRRTFSLNKNHTGGQLTFLIRADDGYIVYLNGNEVIRHNLQAGRITSKTFAQAAVSGYDERLYRRHFVSAKDLMPGENVVAVQVHQASPVSSDLIFDLELTAGKADQANVTVPKEARRAVDAYHQKHYVGPNQVIPDGYLDGGRGMKIDRSGNASSYRELIRVDRRRDARLNDHLKFARSAELMKLSEEDRATRIARYIDRIHSPPEGRQLADLATRYLVREHAGKEVLLGDVAQLCGGGVCRHRTLLFKLMGDEAGLNTTLVRGNYAANGRVGGHAWNELHLKNGKRVLVDCMNPKPDFYFPELTERTVRYYLTVRNRPMYPEARKAAEARD